MPSSFNRNPTGINGSDLPTAEDQTLACALIRYHKEGKTSNKDIARLLKLKDNIQMSDSTVKRRRKELGLSGAGSTFKKIDLAVAEQLIMYELEKDFQKTAGVRTIKGNIAYNFGIHLPRDYIRHVMYTHDPESFSNHAPTAKKIHREKKYPIGIHERWSADGHDKLYKIGFPIYGFVDDATGLWLNGDVIPSNRLGNVVAYMTLSTAITYEGLPLQLSTDCGSETTVVYGIMNELRSRYYPNLAPEELPPHVYMRSVHNISIERSWLRLRLDFGDNAVAAFNHGIENGIYLPHDEDHFELCQWLWSKLLRQELNAFMDRRNAAMMRKNKDKAGPSGMSRLDAFREPARWGGRNCLLPIPREDIPLLRAMQERLGGEQLTAFSTPEYSARAQAVYDSLQIQDLSFLNAWFVFAEMLRRLQLQ
ncbi:hypothetical protein H0H93_001268 [Arthromyces matolae]|nr:hypothetical protein H0H93_001268 [Arthromyces matolae]